MLILSVLSYILSFPPFNLFFIIWFFPYFFLKSVEKDKKRKRFLKGILTGTLINIYLVHWIANSLKIAGTSILLQVFVVLLFSLYLGLYFGIFSFISYYIESILFLSIAFSFLEFLKSNLFGGFPWGIIAHSQIKFLPFIRIISLTGVYSISFFVFFISLSILKKRKIVFPVSILIAVLFYGSFLFKYKRTGKELKVAVLQGGIKQEFKWNKNYENFILERYRELVIEAKKYSPELVVFPEASIPGFFSLKYAIYVRNLTRILPANYLIGSPFYEDKKFYNAVILLDKNGEIVEKYFKLHLVPFGEYVPLRKILSKFVSVLNELGDFDRGKEPVVFDIKGIKIAPLICFESLFPRILKKFKNFDLIINFTNDAWFEKTIATEMHLNMTILRAIENKKFTIFCNNSGYSSIISPYGKILKIDRNFFKQKLIFYKISL